MANQEDLATLTYPLSAPSATVSARLPRIWPPALLLGLFWATYSLWRWTEFGASLGFMGFLILLAIGALTTVLFAVWWLAASRVRWTERLLVLGTAAFAGAGTAALAHKSVGPFLLLPGLPLVLTVWMLGLLVVRKWRPRQRALALMSLLCLSCGAFTLLRAEGMQGDGQLALRWRWSPTPEQLYLAEVAGKEETAARLAPQQGLRLQPGDWPGFRGPNRDGDLRGVRIATDWNVTPPKPVWKRRIGPAWSSVVIVADRLSRKNSGVIRKRWFASTRRTAVRSGRIRMSRGTKMCKAGLDRGPRLPSPTAASSPWGRPASSTVSMRKPATGNGFATSPAMQAARFPCGASRVRRWWPATW